MIWDILSIQQPDVPVLAVLSGLFVIMVHKDFG
jgi:hypothetical protein